MFDPLADLEQHQTERATPAKPEHPAGRQSITGRQRATPSEPPADWGKEKPEYTQADFRHAARVLATRTRGVPKRRRRVLVEIDPKTGARK